MSTRQDSSGTMDARQLRDAFGAFITGVTVVTTISRADKPLGFTANSFTSVSLAPPLLLVCPSRHLSSFDVFNSCSHFAVNILAEEQRDIANRFATSSAERFADLAWHRCPTTGNPLIDNTAAVFSCNTAQRIDAGDHIILIGEVAAFAASGKAALGYANGGYFGLSLERRADELTHEARPLTVGIIIAHNGNVLLCPGDNGLTLPQVQVARHTGSLAALQTFLTAAGIAADIGAVYAVVENPRTGSHSVYYRGTAADTNARGLGAYYPVEKLANLADKSLIVMLRRYCLEHQSGSFGLYIGNQDTGDVHHPPTATGDKGA